MTRFGHGPGRSTSIRAATEVLAALIAAGVACGQGEPLEHGAHRSATGPVHSELWGERGELFLRGGPLPDWSFAGYRFGEVPVPTVPVAADVTAFGADGTDDADDTEAFVAAIAATDHGAIRVPPGRYLLSDILWITKPGVVLRGAGPGKTVLEFTTELEDVRPNMGDTSDGRPTSNYSWSGGFVWVKGVIERGELARVTEPARRGEFTLTLDNASRIEPGLVVEIAVADDDDRSLLDHLYGGDAGDTSNFTSRVRTGFATRVERVQGRTVTLERALPFDVRPEWSARVTRFNPRVREVGIEDLTIAFPAKPYAGHFTERGMNAIAMNGVADCWVRNVEIVNCDSGIFLGGSSFCTLDGVVFDADRAMDPRTRAVGHHGVTMGRDSVLTRFDFRCTLIHDVTVSNLAHGNVIKNGRGVALSLDHHKRAPFQNLFCNLDAGNGSRLWKSGGGARLGKNAGARTTFWAIRADTPIPWPRDGFGPVAGPGALTLVGRISSKSSGLSKREELLDRALPARLDQTQTSDLAP
jgi:hypothetical protein